MVRQLVAKLRQKRKGIILINAVLASIIVGLVGIALASIYSGMFSTMSAGKAGSQGEQMAAVETSVIKMKGYDESDSVTHGWKDMSDLVGEDGKQWESKVTLERTKTTDDGNTVKVMKVAVRKTGDLISRYSAEVPLVEGLDVYSKDEIDQMFTTLNSQISQLSSDLDAFKKETADNFTNIINNINQINANLDDLQKMINAETQARVDADKAISNNLSNETKARQAADAALSNQIDSLKSSLTDLQSALNTEISNRQAADKTLQGNINSEAAARQAADAAEAKARQDAINNLQAQINSKYEELYNLYKGLKSRLDGNEFVKSKDSANNIALKYEQKDGESTKSLHGYVDGVEVPLASQNGRDGKDGNIIQEKDVTLKIYVDLKTSPLPSWNGSSDADYFTSTTGNVTAEVSNDITAYSNGPYTKIELASLSAPLGSTTTTLGTSIQTSNHQLDACRQQAINYVHQHIGDFKSRIAQKIPEAAQVTKIVVDAGVIKQIGI